jgi:hypothetical protein
MSMLTHETSLIKTLPLTDSIQPRFQVVNYIIMLLFIYYSITSLELDDYVVESLRDRLKKR